MLHFTTLQQDYGFDVRMTSELWRGMDLHKRGRTPDEVQSHHFSKYSTSKIEAVPLQAKQVQRGGKCIVLTVLDPGPRRVASTTLWPLYSRETRHLLYRSWVGLAAKRNSNNVPTELGREVLSNEPSVRRAVNNWSWAQSEQTKT
jgi:hypothetical protein